MTTMQIQNDQTEDDTWADIPDFSKYQASKLGKIRNKTNKRNLKAYVKPSGYCSVTLRHNNGKLMSCQVHRMIAVTFVSNLIDKPTVNHKDHDRGNNALNNLEWYTHQEQAHHRRKNTSSKTSQRAIWKCDPLSGEDLCLFPSIASASAAINDSRPSTHSNIISVAKKRPNIHGNIPTTAYGFRWRYVEETTHCGELWKPVELIKNCEDYWVSNQGRLRSPSGRISSGSSSGTGYLKFSISSRSYLAHRVVAQAWIPNDHSKTCVNHINGLKHSNTVENLEWVSLAENSQHSHVTGLCKTGKQIRQICMVTNKTIATFRNAAVAARELGIDRSSITKVARQLVKQCGNYYWRYDSI